MKQRKKSFSIKTIDKRNVWEIQENDVFRMWEAAQKDPEAKDNIPQYISILRTAFDMERIEIDKPVVIKKYEERGFKVGTVRSEDGEKNKWAIKKRSITRVNDITSDNIYHITIQQLFNIIDRNFGGGWESLPQNTRDIIEKKFEIVTTTLPKERLQKKGGIYEKMIKDGYEDLEIEKGTWVEAIFAKEKEIQLIAVEDKAEDNELLINRLDRKEDMIDDLEEDDDFDDDEDFDEDKMTEESYRTTFEETPEDLSLETADISDDDDSF